ncbi:hypothetical protein HPB51_027971 [Rhipicephalus microplus]|uniref:Calponin-homology (CH) domain-containing protein n=1 Tax=Rhipicephalus microplus TaxID=6941 RepID=A0A9J6CYF4_RHIMP|nr:hypothetical protein HPB51_027971 [Rhipicephalus microplus]
MEYTRGLVADVARTPSFTAGDEFVWVEIQEKTFTNWVNEQLRPVGAGVVTDLRRDLSDGLRLISLVEALQKRRLRRIARPQNQHQCLENVQTALTAMAQDNIKLVNIGELRWGGWVDMEWNWIGW